MYCWTRGTHASSLIPLPKDRVPSWLVGEEIRRQSKCNRTISNLDLSNNNKYLILMFQTLKTGDVDNRLRSYYPWVSSNCFPNTANCAGWPEHITDAWFTVVIAGAQMVHDNRNASLHRVTFNGAWLIYIFYIRWALFDIPIPFQSHHPNPPHQLPSLTHMCREEV